MLLTVWKYALGSFHDDKTKKYDNAVCIIRTCILLTYIVTNTVICAGVVRHWNDSTKDSVSSVELVSVVTE